MTATREEFLEASEPLARELGQLPEDYGDYWLVPSLTQPDLMHRVDLAIDGTWVCDCIGHYYHHHCRHSDFVRERSLEMSNETALVPIQLQPPPMRLPSRAELDTYREIATIALSGAMVLPDSIKKPEQAMAIMLYGRALGLDPMIALQEIDIVKGTPQPRAKLMAALIVNKEKGNQLIVKELSDTKVVIHFERPSRRIKVDHTFTWAQIEKAKLAFGNNLAYPQDRLVYYGIKRIARIYAWDLVVLSPTGFVEEEGEELEEAEDTATVDGQVVNTRTGEIMDTPVDKSVDTVMDTPAMQEFGRQRDTFGPLRPEASAEPDDDDLIPPPEEEEALDAEELQRQVKALIREIKGTWDADTYRRLYAALLARWPEMLDVELPAVLAWLTEARRDSRVPEAAAS